MDTMLIALGHVFSWPGILIPIAGTLLAMVASFLPGIGNASVAVVALVLSANWDPVSVLLLFGALTGGATFMGSITAILFNIPGSVASTPALLDGYPLARLGFPKTAIACAATASAVGSVFGVSVLLVLLPIITPYVLAFGPLEIFLISVLGLLTVISLPTKSKMTSALMVMLGLLAAMVGSDPNSGHSRWTMGSLEMSLGLSIVPVMLGVYTLGEILHWTNRSNLSTSAEVSRAAEDSTIRGTRAVFSNLGLTFRSSWIGTLVGMVPGIGGTVAGFIAYGHAVQTSGTDNKQFGKGDVRGLIAPEAAVDAKDGGSLLPTLALGLPGSEACVILLAVFTMHGLVPGIPMLTTHLALSYTLILALLFSNILTSLVGVVMAPTLSKLTSFRIDKIVLPCLLVCLFSAVQSDGRITDLYTMIFFGLLGYYWRRHDWPTTPFVIAFVLGKLLENNLVMSMQLIALNRIVPSERSLALILAFIIISFLVWKWVRRRTSEKLASDADHSFAFSLICTAVCASMLCVSLWSSSRYSAYAIAVVSTATFLSSIYSIRCWNHQRLFGRGIAYGLKPNPGHGLLLSIIFATAPCTWLLGFSLTMGLTTTAWIVAKGWPAKPNYSAAVVWGIGVLVLTEWVTSRMTDTLLDRGRLWTYLI